MKKEAPVLPEAVPSGGVEHAEESFVRTWRLLAVARLRTQAGAILALLVLFGAWGCWLFVGQISIYASSQTARFESERSPQPIQAAAEGVVRTCNLGLGEHVREGDVLVTLDARTFELELAEVQATRRSLDASILALEHEIDAQQRARAALTRLVDESRRAGVARVAVSQTGERFQLQEAEVVRKLNEKELASKLDHLKSEGASATIHAQVAATSAEASQATSTHIATLLDRDVQIAALSKLLSDARAQVDVLDAQIAKIDHEIKRRTLRASTSGTLADIAPCAPGMTVARDQKLATLVPEVPIRVVAFFKPEDAIGRVKEGQSAILRVDNFPWTQFGTVGATVARVGSEPRDGMVRVELDVARPNPAIPVIHGLTAVTDIQVERVTALKLILRTLAKQITPVGARPPPGAARQPVSER